MKLVIDVETNGFLDKLDFKIHCVVFKDIETEEVYSYNPDNLTKSLQLLNKATLLIGHNIQGFDLPALKKYFNFNYTGEILDTLLCSRLIYTNRQELDFQIKDVPPKLIGRHSLESWGYRLGLRKGDFQEFNTFDEWTLDMQDYCERDVEVTYKLYQQIIATNYSKEAIELEHKFAHWIRKQERFGVYFDESSAENLLSILTKRRLQLEENLAVVFPDWEQSQGYKRYKRDNKKKGIKAGVPVRIFKIVKFNPNSRDHIANRLQTLGWKPKHFTSTGKPEVSEKILKSLEYPEAKVIAEYLMIQKRLGQLSDGEQAYLKLTKRGKIYGQVNTNGAVTGRCTHFNPNLAQVCSSDLPYGKELRSLFTANADMVMCGVDFSGLELRVLSHYLGVYDNGYFQKQLLEDDIHSQNQKSLGLSSRSKAKTFIYAYIYGGGNKKLGEILNVSYDEAKRIRETFEKKLPALKTLKDAVVSKYRRTGFVNGLDKRKLMCRAEHSSLNTLVQSAGSLLVKQGTIILNDELHKAGFVWGKDYAQVLHIHDEIQFVVSKDKLEKFKEITKSIFKKTQDHFNFRCPLDGEIKVGQNWSDTH